MTVLGLNVKCMYCNKDVAMIVSVFTEESLCKRCLYLWSFCSQGWRRPWRLAFANYCHSTLQEEIRPACVLSHSEAAVSPWAGLLCDLLSYLSNGYLIVLTCVAGACWRAVMTFSLMVKTLMTMAASCPPRLTWRAAVKRKTTRRQKRTVKTSLWWRGVGARQVWVRRRVKWPALLQEPLVKLQTRRYSNTKQWNAPEWWNDSYSLNVNSFCWFAD